MHYCFLSFGSWEGNASHMRSVELGKELVHRDVRVSYIVDDTPYNREVVALPAGATSQFSSPTTGLKQFSARRRIIQKLNPDYLHVLNPSPKSCLTLKGLSRVSLVTDWDEWRAMKPFGRLHHLRFALLDRWHRRHSRLLLVASKYMQEQFAARFGVQAVYLPYATYFKPNDACPSPFAEPTAVYMGNMYPGYDHDIVFRAAVLLRDRGLRPHIEFVGGGPELDRWRQFVQANELHHIKINGFVPDDDAYSHLRHAHVLLFPIRPTIGNLSRCPAKTYAYAQARRPIITCRVGEVPGVLGDAATYVDPTPEAFADALATAMANPQPDVDYGVERHNWSARADTLLAALAVIHEQL